jgi:hypothetical protein
MMELPEDADAAVLQPVDHVHLPGRARAVQRRSVELRREASERTVVAAFEAMTVNVRGQVDRLVLGPPVPAGT